MREAVLGFKGSIPFGFFDRVQCFALKVLYEREDKQGVVLDLTSNRRDIRPSEPLDGPKAAFPGHELVLTPSSPGGGTHQKGLEQAILCDRASELVQLSLGKRSARLLRVWSDRRDRQTVGSAGADVGI